MDKRIQEIARNLGRSVPQPKAKVIRPTKSFRKLKPGDYLRTKTPWWIAGVRIETGSLLVVSTVSAGGMGLNQPKPGAIALHFSEIGSLIQWSDPDWSGHFEKVPKRDAEKEIGTAS